MWIFIVGFIAGVAEYFLLRRVVHNVQIGNMLAVLGFFMVKLAVLAAALGITILLKRSDLAWCGVGLASAILLCAFASFARTLYKDKKQGRS